MFSHFFIDVTIAQWQWFCLLCSGSWVRALLLPKSLINFFSFQFESFFRETRVRILTKTASFPAAFSGNGISFALTTLSSYACHIKEECRRVPELGQIFTFLYFYYIQKRKKYFFYDFLRVNSQIMHQCTNPMYRFIKPPSKVSQN